MRRFLLHLVVSLPWVACDSCSRAEKVNNSRPSRGFLVSPPPGDAGQERKPIAPPVPPPAVTAAQETLARALFGEANASLGSPYELADEQWVRWPVHVGQGEWTTLVISPDGSKVFVQDPGEGVLSISDYVEYARLGDVAMRIVAKHPLAERECEQLSLSCTFLVSRRGRLRCSSNPAVHDACLWRVYAGHDAGGARLRLFTGLVDPFGGRLVGVGYANCGVLPEKNWKAFLEEGPSACSRFRVPELGR